MLDQFNIHGPAARYEAFLAERTLAIAARVMFHETSMHSSWLDMAEIEISVFKRGCRSQPVGDRKTLAEWVAVLEAERNAADCTTHWQFISQQARAKLGGLYPINKSTARKSRFPGIHYGLVSVTVRNP